MLSKIEVYREVLEIEPNSKAFFPLARQLATEGRHDEAVAVLCRGIGFHPDHLEAKFLLIELLTRQGREEQAGEIFADVGSMLARYPSVWLLWSKTAATRSKDPALAMLFLSHYFQDQTLTWADVMERGLKSLSQTESPSECNEADEALADAPAAPAAPAAMPVEHVERPILAAPVVPLAAPGVPSEEPEEPETPIPARSEHREPADGPELRGAREILALADILDAAEAPGERNRSRPAKSREQAVRTKTMAAVLAGQGDTAGALEIYEDLLAVAPNGPEREELVELKAALSPDAAPDPQATTAAHNTPLAHGAVAPGPKGSAKLASFLEALAGRLEARAGS
ncbi:tetratricopeptide repeat protein [Desulfovibrio sp. TomC]|uniref:tetratricopeptide repeat protein n=1 Tax=Desulfovibrio sp. TomC TaxID=1562888 RepID=UPI0005750573|nr:tetratricopeptide repeat protein [Desulfovibrio sp. TomC]KHK04243.1 hypothetical protein NY78_0021 [Desulfovibrio sp. TomC]